VDVEQGGGLVLVLLAWRWSGFGEANRSHPHQDKHQALSSTPLRPLSLQDGLRLLLHSVGTIHQEDGRIFPDAVGTIHQEAGPQASQWVW